jgi:hypothetical protein
MEEWNQVAVSWLLRWSRAPTSTHLVNGSIATTIVVEPVGEGGVKLTIQSMAHTENGKLPLLGGRKYGGGGNLALAFYLQGSCAAIAIQSALIPFQK